MKKPISIMYSRVITIVVLLFHFYNVQSNPLLVSSGSECKSCHYLSTTKINVHLVPHSHDDVGWLKSFTQYYTGTGTFDKYENAGVQYILDSTIQALKADQNRRYIQVETAFFWKWWLNQNNDTRQDVIDLVNDGQLEMVNGAWSMNDEATAHYQSIVDQFTWGFRILENTLGQCGHPKIGWQIDPFGHSREHASLLKQFGFSGLVIGRLDYRDKNRRKAESSLDFMWKSSANLDDSQIITTMFPDFYVDEPGYHFDIMYGDSITDANLKQKVDGFANILSNYRSYYKTSNIMMPMGNDFTYQKAERNFENIDKLIKGFVDHADYHLVYSTPSCYIQAVQNEIVNKSVVLEEKSDDFFPYASNANAYWTGYFVSRPTVKRFERQGNNILQSVKQLTTFSRINNQEYDSYTIDLRQAMGVMQHHDAITGTEKQAVADDYVKMLHEGIKKAEEPLSDILINLLKLNVSEDVKLDFSTCLLSNVSVCPNSQKDKFLVALYNPLAHIVTHYVRLPVNDVNYKITGPDGEETYDIVDPIHNFGDLLTDEVIGTKDLVFAANLPALGIKLYYVEKNSTKEENNHSKRSASDNLVFGTPTNGFTIDPDTGKLNSVTLQGQTLEITQEFLYYTTSSSGAYLFRPYETEAISITNANPAQNTFYRGNLIDEYHQIISDEITQIIRVYKDRESAYIEFDWLVGDLQFVSGRGKEVITRYTIKDFNNNNTFYTDSNGREQIKRALNYRSDYQYDPSDQPVASNYYPVTSKIVIKDETKNLEVAILNDRAQGGTSLTNGSIELMLHRRLIRDDGLGVNEVLSEVQYGKGLYARGQHYLTFGNITSDGSAASFERRFAQAQLLAPLVLIADATDNSTTLENIQHTLNFKFEGLKGSLPDSAHLLTLEPWIDSYILRLEHIFEINEDPELSKPVTVDLNGLFALFNITEIKETTLGANEYLAVDDPDQEGTKTVTLKPLQDPDLEETKTVTLNPMQIRTFIFKTDKNNIGGHDDGTSYGGNGAGKTTSLTISLICALVIHKIFN